MGVKQFGNRSSPILSGLIWVQTVWDGYQPSSKEYSMSIQQVTFADVQADQLLCCFSHDISFLSQIGLVKRKLSVTTQYSINQSTQLQRLGKN